MQAQALIASGNRRNLGRADRLLQKSLRVEPDLPEALLGLGQLAERKRRTDEAIRRYKRLTQVAPKDPEAAFRLGRLLFADRKARELGRTELQRASTLDAEGAWGERARRLLTGR